MSVCETPPSSQLSVLSPEECGVEMWAGISSPATCAQSSVGRDHVEADSVVGGDDMEEEGEGGGLNDGSDVVQEADMEWGDETDVKVKKEEEEAEEEQR